MKKSKSRWLRGKFCSMNEPGSLFFFLFSSTIDEESLSRGLLLEILPSNLKLSIIISKVWGISWWIHGFMPVFTTRDRSPKHSREPMASLGGTPFSGKASIIDLRYGWRRRCKAVHLMNSMSTLIAASRPPPVSLLQVSSLINSIKIFRDSANIGAGLRIASRPTSLRALIRTAYDSSRKSKKSWERWFTRQRK